MWWYRQRTQQIRFLIIFLAGAELLLNGLCIAIMHLLELNPVRQTQRIWLWIMLGITMWVSLLGACFAVGKSSSLCVMAAICALLMSSVECILAGFFVVKFENMCWMYAFNIVTAIFLTAASIYYRLCCREADEFAPY